MENTSCIVCGSNRRSHLFNGLTLQAPSAYQYVQCDNCGLIYLDPRPSPQEITNYYPKEYGPYRTAIEDEKSRLMQWARKRKLIRRRKLIENHTKKTSGNILDVGCATGLFLHEMELAGWNVDGVEIADSAVEYCKTRFGMEIFQGFLPDSPFSDGFFDAITFWDVLEHIFDPKEALRISNNLLRPGGVIFINIPNWESFDRHIFGPYWAGFDIPRHLYVFKHHIITQMLQSAGFNILGWECIIPSFFAFKLSYENKLSKKNRSSRILKFLNITGIRLIFEPYFSLVDKIGKGSTITVIAQKPRDMNAL